jgi:amino acid adenylation domain-containing protein
MTSVLALMENRARVQRGAVAISFGGRRVTYAQLDERADCVSRLLLDAGVVAEALVALYLDRSPDLIASLLGVWKAGGAYLPIDPTNPQQRVASVLEDAKVAFVLTSRNLSGSLPITDARLLYVEDLASAPETGEQHRLRPLPAPKPLPEQLAYVIYTSGSTGRPKGVEITHGALANVIESIGKDVALQPSDVVLASASIAFDISNEEIFLPLVAGACVHLLEPEFVGDGRKLVEVMRQCSPSLVFGTPTSWRLVLEAGWEGDPNMQVIVGGEVLPLSLARTLAAMARGVWNHYGPTETAICATRERIGADTEEVTLGLPIDNTRIYVLDKDLRPAPAGEVGEIHIAGAGVGRGYRNRPELSERSFIPDRFSAAPGARMYKTGDLGRLLPDGRLVFQGRVDKQIKLRGFRIELEEIESAICALNDVHAAVAQVVEVGASDHRLVAYFLGGPQVTVAELRESLRQRLPYYMLPSQLVPLESLPMTVNGKIDGKALDAVRLKFEAEALAEAALPQSDNFEAKLRAIWQRLLKARSIGPDDDFFEMGGHSLLAARMFAEIEKITGRRIPLSVLIRNPTVSKLASYIASRPTMEWPGLLPISDQGSLPPLFIAHGLHGSLLSFRQLAKDLGPDQPVYGIQLIAPPKATMDELKLEAFAAQAVEEICAVEPVGPYRLAGHSLGGLLVYEIASQLRRRGKEIGLLALLDCELEETHRGQDAPSPSPILVKATWLRWRKKFARLFENGIVNTTWRQIRYYQLLLKIWLLRQTHREGNHRPQLFGSDAYIAFFAQRYQPLPIDAEAVLFVAEDGDFTGQGWSRLLRGRLSVQKVPGSHETILDPPNVSVLASELARQLDCHRSHRTIVRHRREEVIPASR